ncbi:MAG TPA: GIY-YIG nuclease family protein [Candidatus Paceibacterota bacterium]|nr:GIY-YIG nuclease family protein [Candidatus Paceibacterota bacterium]
MAKITSYDKIKVIHKWRRGCQPKAGPPWAEVVINMYYVYILYSDKSNKIYKGSTADIKNRLKEHNAGEVQSTKAFRPWQLIYLETFINKTDARKEELFLKSGKGRERVKYLLKNTLINKK